MTTERSTTTLLKNFLTPYPPVGFFVFQQQVINIHSVVRTTRRAPRSALRRWDSSSTLQWINDKSRYRNKLFTVWIFVFLCSFGELNLFCINESWSVENADWNSRSMARRLKPTACNWCTTDICSGATKWKHRAERRTWRVFQSPGLLTSCSGEELILESVTYSQFDAECRVSVKTFTSLLSRIDFPACLSPLLSHHAPVCSRSFLTVCVGAQGGRSLHTLQTNPILQLRLHLHHPD